MMMIIMMMIINDPCLPRFRGSLAFSERRTEADEMGRGAAWTSERACVSGYTRQNETTTEH